MIALLAIAPLVFGAPQPAVAAPRLVVVVSIDQFRGDYVDRFASKFLPPKSGTQLGGFRFLTETGADFRDAMHNHFPTHTAVGHTALLTGSVPAIHGIIANEWYDRATGKKVYCTADTGVETVGGKSDPMSPKNLKVGTVGDELKMATNGKSKVVGVALKDRASILMAGHAADTVIWFDNKTGNFVTSTWYAKDKKLPKWVEDFNAKKRLDAIAGKAWEPLLAAPEYATSRNKPGTSPQPDGKPFSHRMPEEKGEELYKKMWTSPWGNEHTLAAAAVAIEAEDLGKDEYPDILAINLSSNDYIGHEFGPNSPEVMDITVRTDRQLSDFFNKLDKWVPGGMDNVAVVLSGDHGVLPIAEEASKVYKMPADSGVGKRVEEAIELAFTAWLGEGDYVVGYAGQNLYLNQALLAQHQISLSKAAEIAARAARAVPGVFLSLTRDQLLNGQYPDYPFRSRIANGYNAKMGGDLVAFESPGFYSGGSSGTGHASIWGYDAHVPILFRARGVKPGKYLRRVYTTGIAPTLCKLLGIESPTGSVGEALVDELVPPLGNNHQR